MAYIIRNQLNSPLQQLYTTGYQQTKRLVVGLGNISDEYATTRHNAGFMALDAFAERLDVSFVTKRDLKAMVAVAHDGNTQVILAKPLTMMNASGDAVQALQQYYQVQNDGTLVIHDELDLPLGEVRLKTGGGSAGQNGIKSIIARCGGEFSRVRIGIGPKEPEQMDTADFVLQRFTAPQRRRLSKIIELAVDTAKSWLAS